MISPEAIANVLTRQSPAYGRIFAQDGGLSQFKVVPEAPVGSKVEVFAVRLTSKDVCFEFAGDDNIPAEISKLYTYLKDMVEKEVTETLTKLGVSQVVGKSRAVLYGNWQVVRSEHLIQFWVTLELHCVNPKL